MATLPTVPSFTFQEVPTVAKLNQLAGAVSFVSQVPIVASLKMSGTQAVAANTNATIQWGTKECDSDGMWSSGTNTRLTAQTQGYYKMHAIVAVSSATSGSQLGVFFQQTTGVNNPAGSGHTVQFGANATWFATTTETNGVHLSGLTPCLYVADYVEVHLFAGVATTVQNAYQRNATDGNGKNDGASCLYAVYAFEGP